VSFENIPELSQWVQVQMDPNLKSAHRFKIGAAVAITAELNCSSVFKGKACPMRSDITWSVMGGDRAGI